MHLPSSSNIVPLQIGIVQGDDNADPKENGGQKGCQQKLSSVSNFQVFCSRTWGRKIGTPGPAMSARGSNVPRCHFPNDTILPSPSLIIAHFSGTPK